MNTLKKLFAADSLIICFSFLLSIFCFILDLMIPWAIGSILYIPAILLFLTLNKPGKIPVFFALLVTFFTIAGLIIQQPQHEPFRIITNHFLALLVIWGTSVLVMFYKKGHEVRSYLAAIVDSSNDAIIGKDLGSVVTSWNTGAERLYGYKASEMIGRSVSLLIPENILQEEEELIAKIKAGQRVFDFETLRKRKDGTPAHISLTLSPIRDSKGRIIGVSSIAKDITRRVEDEKKLEILNHRIYLEKVKLEEVLGIEEHLNSIFDINRLADFVVEKTTKVLEADKCSLMFYDQHSRSLYIKAHKGLKEEYITGPCPIGDSEHFSCWVARTGSALLVTDVEMDERCSRKSREGYKTKSFCCVPIKLGQQLMGVINVADKTGGEGNVFTDLDLKILNMIVRQVAVALENTRLYREMKYLVITDPMTNLHNYRHFSKSLDYEISRLKRYPGNLSLLMIDVDDFKSYNDTFGHLEGDEALRQIGKILTQNVREVDIACRYAGDEFAVILPGASLAEAKIVADKLYHAVSKIDLQRKLTIGIGAAFFYPHMSKYELIQAADIALYQVKKEARKQSKTN